MKKPLVIIKLGGSVVTDKAKARGVFRASVVARLAKEISEARKKKPFDLILVHGAGSFGHPIAKKYQLYKGYISDKSLKGFALCKAATIALSTLVLNSLIYAKINASIVVPNNIIRTKGRQIMKFDLEVINDLLGKNLVPVLYGDMVFDDKQGFAVVSGDLIVSYLARKLNAKRVIFVSDVDGVFDKNPKVYKKAKLISEINGKNYREVIGSMEIHNKNDVSGEMKGKILTIKEQFSGRFVQLINGFVKNNLYNALLGLNKGTRIIF